MKYGVKEAIKPYKQIIWFLTSSMAIVVAQTTNTGVLHVESNTIFSSVDNFDNKVGATYTNDGEAYFYANYNNHGITSFSKDVNGQRYTRFEGATVQQLTGDNTSYFYDVLFNNKSDAVPSYELYSQISVAGEADFAKGIVKDDDFGGLMIFEDDATHKEVSDASHVDGTVQKKGDDVFTYPIGDKQFFRYSGISAPSDVNHHFSSKYYFQNPIGSTVNGEMPTSNLATTLELLDNAEFWTLIRDHGTGHVVLTLSYDPKTTPESILVQETSLKITRWNAADSVWEDLGGVVDVANNTVTTLVNLSQYGIFTLAKGKTDTPPKDEFEIFNGISSNGDGKNDYFHIKGLKAPNNLKIFNRWGVKVFDTDNYGVNNNVFRGYSNGRATIGSREKLPTGTYFYVLTYQAENRNQTKSGYLYLTTD